MKPLLSIIIPVYNTGHYLSNCIDSILSSTFSEFELLLVDDGSTDISVQVCDDYALKDTRIHVFHKPNGGASSARNYGIDKSQASWITFIDADDFISQTFLENLWNAVLLHPETDFVHAGFTNFRNGHIAEVAQRYEHYHGNDMNRLCPIYRGRPYSKLHRKELLKRIRFDELVISSEDLLFTTDYLSGIKTYTLIDEVGYYYRCDNPNSIMHTPIAMSYDYCLHFFYHHWSSVHKLISTHDISQFAYQIREIQVADSLLYCVISLYNETTNYKERISKLKKDFAPHHLQCVKYIRGKRNKLVLLLFRLRLYKLFDWAVKRLIKN